VKSVARDTGSVPGSMPGRLELQHRVECLPDFSHDAWCCSKVCYRTDHHGLCVDNVLVQVDLQLVCLLAVNHICLVVCVCVSARLCACVAVDVQLYRC